MLPIGKVQKLHSVDILVWLESGKLKQDLYNLTPGSVFKLYRLGFQIFVCAAEKLKQNRNSGIFCNKH